jgi:hypothetical protein
LIFGQLNNGLEADNIEDGICKVSIGIRSIKSWAVGLFQIIMSILFAIFMLVLGQL